MTNKEFKQLVKTEDYLESKTKFYENYNFVGLIIAVVAFGLWTIKDVLNYNMEGFLKEIYLTLVCRLLPLFVAIPSMVLVKKQSKHAFALFNLMTWVSIAGALFKDWYIYKFMDSHILGDGWMVYFVMFYAISLEADDFWSAPVDILIFSVILYFLDRWNLVPCELGALHVITTSLMVVVPLHFSTIFYKKALATHFVDSSKLNNLAKRDALTNCYNRFVIKDITDNNKLKEDCTIFIIDVDNFKKVNTELGHNFGDIALTATVESLGRSCRNTKDKIIRYGGDEFVVYLQGIVNPKSFYDRFVYHRVRTVLKEKNITHSVGAAFGKPGENIYDVIAKADVYLYDIKNTNKNGISFQNEN